MLDAGPLVLILTSLIAIFTIGLGDEDVNNPNRLSAYSVFNRGFQRIMGSVDVDSLLAQHVGGGMMIGALGRDDVGNGEPLPAAAGVVRRPRPDPREDYDYDADENGQNDIDNFNINNNNNRGGSRKSGKKARRRNLEQRRDAQRQREAAVALGVEVDDVAGTEEMIEIQRLIEAQIAAEQHQNGPRNN